MKSLLGRMKLWQKFALLGTLSFALVAVTFGMYLTMNLRDIRAARVEMAGVQPARKLLQIVQITQQHRALSASVLGGNTALESKRDAKHAEVDKAVAEFAEIVSKDVDDVKITAAWDRAAQGWKSLSHEVAGRSIPGKDSYVRHVGLIADYLSLLERIDDHFGLSLDSEVDSLHLISGALTHLPNLAESLGQTRARGALFLAQGSITPEDRVALTAQIQLVRMHHANMAKELDKAIEANAQLKASLGGISQESGALAEKAMQLAREQVIAAEKLTYPSSDFVAAFTQAIDGQFKVNEVALDELGKLLNERADRLQHSMAIVLGLIALVTGLVLWLSVTVTRSITASIEEAVKVAEALARGDLTQRAEARSSDELGRLMSSLGSTVDRLSGIVGRVKESVDGVSTAAKQIAAGNADLSSRTEEQASSLEETASSMEELTSTVKQNAENARQANQLAVGASDVALKGGEVVSEVVQTMVSIRDSSKKIADIISVIDGIAFQTNILALNAAVEAARAGEQGRGFAVVASEVRNLAQRSAAAAKEIKTLIGDSVDKVEKGSELVGQAGKTMEEVVAAVKRVTDIMGEISAASQEQSSGIEQVNQAVTQMDEVTQQNAALVEEAAAAAESLEEQAGNLLEAVAAFRLAGTFGAAATKPVVVAEHKVQTLAPIAERPFDRVQERRGPNRAKNVARVPAKAAAKPAASAKTGTDDAEWEEF